MDIVKVKDGEYRIKSRRGSVTVVVGTEASIVGSVSKTPFVISAPGEYEVEGISVFAYAQGEGIATVLHLEDLTVLVTAGVIAESLIEDLDVVDVLILGLGQNSSRDLVTMVGNIEPTYIVPQGEADKVAAFIKDFEHASRETDKLVVNKATLSSDVTEVVVL